jgi:hypothetical protein
MELPITQNELNFIIDAIKNKNPQLYGKLWCYRFNLNNKQKGK